LTKVLRARIGQEFEVVAENRVYLGRIKQVSEREVVFELSQELESVEAEAKSGITLWLAVFKFDRMEWAIEKATELGVARIVPVIARRTEKHLAAAAERRVDRWRRIVHEAAQQSRGSRMPEIAQPLKLREVLRQPDERAARMVLAENERQTG